MTATAVFFHAHPDDESISTAGTMMLAAAAGHRVVLVIATSGELGDSNHPVEEIGLGTIREAETRAAAEILGVHRLEFLGYHDSGMENESTNEDPRCFWQADVDEAAERLAVILREESADLLTCYDPEGTYGHPDHVQVHRVGVRAAERAGVALVYEATVDRDHVRELVAAAAQLDLGDEDPFDEELGDLDDGKLGVAGSRITHRVDVTSVIDRKRAAMAAHSSQISDESFFMKLPPEAFEMAFGTEWYIRRDIEPDGTVATDLFELLSP